MIAGECQGNGAHGWEAELSVALQLTSRESSTNDCAPSVSVCCCGFAHGSLLFLYFRR